MEKLFDLTVGDLARASGVNIRTLHHYDALGLLVPLRTANGYQREEVLRLQEILFYRDAGSPLGEFAALLADGAQAQKLAHHRGKEMPP